MSSYELKRPQKGIAFIINNLHFKQKETRIDVDRLKTMFKIINVQVDFDKHDQDKDKLNAIAYELKNKDMSSYNLCFLVVISHGSQGDKIECSDGTAFDIDLFVESLGENESMVGYPKILIFDFCRGDEVNVGRTKATPCARRIPFGADIFIGFSTSEGYTSSTSPTGSPFINAFCTCIEKSYDKMPFLNIFQEVQDMTSQTVTRVRDQKYEVKDAMQVQLRTKKIFFIFLRLKNLKVPLFQSSEEKQNFDERNRVKELESKNQQQKISANCPKYFSIIPKLSKSLSKCLRVQKKNVIYTKQKQIQ